MLYVKHRPDTCGNRPLALGIEETPFSSMAFNVVPETPAVTTVLPNGSTVNTWPFVIGNGGGVKAGQKSLEVSVVGQVRASRSPPEFVIAKSIEGVAAGKAVRIESVTTSPISDSHRRPSTRPQTSDLGIATLESPTFTSSNGRRIAFNASTRAWIAGSGVTPIVHGLWKSAVL